MISRRRGWAARQGAWWLTAVQIAAIAVAFYLLSHVSARFADLHGASYVFPNAALILVAGAGFGWVGVVGVYIGSLFVNWGAASTPAGMLVFSLIHAGTTAIPAIALRAPARQSRHRIGRTIVYGGILNNLFSAGAGTSYLILSGRLTSAVSAVQVGVLWWMSDLVAAIVLGIPVLLLLRSTTLLSKWDRDLYWRWWRQWRHPLTASGLLLGAAAVLFLFNMLQIGFPDWMAVLLLVPIGYAAFHGGVGPAVVVNLGASLIYVVAALHAEPMVDGANSVTVLGPLYLMLILMAAASIVGGLLIGANRLLVRRLERKESLLERDFERIVTTLSAAIEAKDPLTLGHVERVAAMAVEVGRRCGLDEESLTALRFGALLHDVGKIGVPEQILNKPRKLNDSEQAIMQRHVEHGIRIIGHVRALQGVLPLIRYHQERWDGATSGVQYPGYFGLRGEDIPLGARILSAVDSFDAITNDRPYRSAQPPRAAVAELRREAGRQFDPRVVEIIAAMIEEADQESTATLHS